MTELTSMLTKWAALLVASTGVHMNRMNGLMSVVTVEMKTMSPCPTFSRLRTVLQVNTTIRAVKEPTEQTRFRLVEATFRLRAGLAS